MENEVDELCADAHAPKSFPFVCKRRGCGVRIKDAVELAALKAELAALKADKTVQGKKVYAKAIALHADAHGQQMPYQQPVTDIPTEKSILDLLHALDLNLPKVDMKYTILDPKILQSDRLTLFRWSRPQPRRPRAGGGRGEADAAWAGVATRAACGARAPRRTRGGALEGKPGQGP